MQESLTHSQKNTRILSSSFIILQISQGPGVESSVSDPDPDWIRVKMGQRFLMWFRIGNPDPDGSRAGLDPDSATTRIRILIQQNAWIGNRILQNAWIRIRIGDTKLLTKIYRTWPN
jgi:hypothetical protein